MNSYFALHKDYKLGEEFITDMGYGFKPGSPGNWFKDSPSQSKNPRTPPSEGDFVYVMQRQKPKRPYQLVGKYKIVGFTQGNSQSTREKTHRAELQNSLVPPKPIFLDDKLLEKVFKKGHEVEYNDLEKHLKTQNASFKHPLNQDVCDLLDWMLAMNNLKPENSTQNKHPGDDEQHSEENVYKNSEQKVRQGQNKFRKNVEKVWNGKQCAVTGINFEPLLIASHIVRFSDCKEGEHWDGANGMFLTAHLDALFDKYLITFIEKSERFNMIYSRHVDRQALESINIKENNELNIKALGTLDLLKFKKYMLEHNKLFNARNK